MTETPKLLVEKDGPIGWIIFNQPEKRNAVSQEMWELMPDYVHNLATDDPPVGERDRRRPVPRLHQAGVVGVEALQLVRHVVAVLVGLGDHHHQRVRKRTPGEDEQLEHVVEHRRVGAVGTDHRQDLCQVGTEQL